MRTRFLDLVVVPLIAVIVLGHLAAGCSDRPSLTPNRDKALRKKSTEFAADSAKRHPYQADAERGGEAVARAQVGYVLDRIDVVNLSDEEWSDVEIWLNERYVVGLPKMEPGNLKTINFKMLFDADGKHFPTNSNDPAGRVNKVEILRDGKLYDVPVRLGD
jgi:hypothetical protein